MKIKTFKRTIQVSSTVLFAGSLIGLGFATKWYIPLLVLGIILGVLLQTASNNLDA